MNVLVTGANGFVGSALIKRLSEEGHHIIALVRGDHSKNFPQVKWIEGDLLKPESLPYLEQVDKAFYLVHGLKGEEAVFEYEESVAAVNFVNWIRPTGAGIIYLGGLGPSGEILSPHLRSRHLTGSILGASGLPVLEFRASIILGEGSTSFEMIKAMVERIPFRPEFALMNQRCQPLALVDLLRYLEASLNREVTGHEIIEIGGSEIVTYGELMDLYAELAGVKRKKIKLPEVEVRVLMKVLDYAIPEHAKIGKKLTESLATATILNNDSGKVAFPEIEITSLRVAMDLAQSSSTTRYSPLWERDFLKMLLSDKILTQSGLLSPDLLKNLEKMAKLKDIITRR